MIVREDQTTVLYFIEHECLKRNEATKKKQSVS